MFGKNYLTIFLFLSSLLFFSCEHPSEPSFSSPDGKIPVISGLLMNANSVVSPIQINTAVWRTPNEQHQSIVRYFGNKKSPYFVARDTGSFVISYSFPTKSLVKLFLIKARLPENNPILTITGSPINLEKVISTIVLVDTVQYAGMYQLSVDKSIFKTSGYGFYQLYLSVGNYLQIADCVFFETKDDIPSDLYELVMKAFQYE